jgi:nucleoside-diphosphate-sugar epimerase
MRKRCFITGATGLIGKQVLSNLKETWEVFGLVRKPEENGSGHLRAISCDLAKDWSTDAFPDRVEAVIHLAQSQHYREFPAQSDDIFRVNVSSTHRLLDYAHRAHAETFVLASSGGIYGYGDEPFQEESPISGRGDLGFYLGTKLCSEILAEAYTGFMNVIILRFFFVYGPGQPNDRLIPRLIIAVKRGSPIILHGEEGIKINPIYVTDAANAVCHALELTGSHKINVAGPEVKSLKQIGQHIGIVLKREPVFNIQRQNQPHHLVGATRRMGKLLGQPQVQFEHGILTCIEGMPHG